MENKGIQLFSDKEIITKDGRKFTRLVGGFGDNKPMFTVWQAGELLGLKTGKIVEDFERNKNNFEQDIDFSDLKSVIPQKDNNVIAICIILQMIKKNKLILNIF